MEYKNANEREIYRAGIKKGIWWFTVNKDGKQVVGVSEQDINEVFKDVDSGEYD